MCVCVCADVRMFTHVSNMFLNQLKVSWQSIFFKNRLLLSAYCRDERHMSVYFKYSYDIGNKLIYLITLWEIIFIISFPLVGISLYIIIFDINLINYKASSVTDIEHL